LNITVCAVAIFMLSSPIDLDPTNFRLLTGGTLLSLIYDLVWHKMIDYAAEEQQDGGM